MQSKFMRTWVCGGFAFVAMLAVQGEVALTMAGGELSIGVPSSHAGDKVVLCWDDADKGSGTNGWAHVRELTGSVPAEGARYIVDLNAAGFTNGQICRVLTFSPLEYLDVLGTFSATAYVDTGLKDTDCYGVAFGFYAPEKTSDWGYFIGSNESTGFVVGNNSGNFNSWNWAYRNGKKTPRPSVFTDRINEVVFGSGKFTLNGADVNTSLDAGAVGTSGREIRIGNWAQDSRRQYGWWSHVSFTGSDGSKLIDYIPVRIPATERVAFLNRVTGTFVYSSGTGEFTAGTVTNTVEVLNTSQVYQPRDFEPITVSVSGTKLTAHVPDYLAGDQLVLVWDDADKGTLPADWAHSAVLAEALSAGGTVSADLAHLGVPNGQSLRVFAMHRFDLLDMVKVSAASYVDTGITDSESTRAKFGFYAEASDYTTKEWGIFMGTGDGTSADMTGFVLSLANGNPAVWYWKACGYRSGTDRPSVSPTQINEADISIAGFVVNGTTVKAPLNAATLGTRGANIHLGTASQDGRHQSGWWSYLELAGVDGRNLIEYVPVRRVADGKVGFYDRIGNRFVGPTGSGEMEAGTVTNEQVTIVQRCSESLRPRLPQPFEVSVDGSMLTVKVSSALATDQLQLVWDGHAYEFVSVVPAEGGTYQVDLSALDGGARASEYTVQGVQKMDLLDRIKMPDSTCYVNTGVKDTDCHGVVFGFLGVERSEAFANFIGSDENNGFTVGSDNTKDDGWYWAFYDGKKYPRPTVRTDAINEAVFANGTFTLNGTVVNSDLRKGVVGASGRNMFVGTWSKLWRFWYGWWSYVRFDDAGGNALVDYIPARRRLDGKVGFFDRATRTFVFSSSTGTFEAGTTTNENVSAVHLQRSFALDTLVARATWTGGGDVTRYEDAANWTCENFEGMPVAGIPGPETRVILAGALTGNCNLVGLSSAQIDLQSTVDLMGHTLVLPVDAAFVEEGTVTDSVGGGELHFDVAEGVVATNAQIAAVGSVKVVKTGAGTLVAAKAYQTYTGGTDIRAGTFACGTLGYSGIYGDLTGVVTVRTGATFECNGYDGHPDTRFVLDGGTIANSVRFRGSSLSEWFSNVTLAADSFIRADQTFYFARGLGASASLEMNGHVLTLDIDGNCTFGLLNVRLTGGGTIRQRSGGFLQLGREDGTCPVTAETTTLEINNSLRVYADSTFLDYISLYGGSWDQGTANVCVKRRFAPLLNRWHSTKLLDGATLDLSAQTGVWAASTTAAHYAAEALLTVAPNAAITVEMGDRTVAEGDQIVEWANAQYQKSATFSWGLGLPLSATPRGLFARKPLGCTLIVR